MSNLTITPTALTPKNEIGYEATFTVQAADEQSYTITFPAYMKMKASTSDTYGTGSITGTIGTSPITLKYKIDSSDIYDGYVTFKDDSGTYDNEQVSILFDIKNLLILQMGEGYGDYYKKTLKKDFYSYKQDDSGFYAYDNNSGLFYARPSLTEGVGYSRDSQSIKMQVYSHLFDAHVTTNDIRLDRSAIKGGVLEVFIKAGVSLAQLKTGWTIDSKTIIVDGPSQSLGEKARTGAFQNDTVRYDGSQATYEYKISPNVRDSESVKIKLSAMLQGSGLDEVVINSINILPTGAIYIGGEDA